MGTSTEVEALICATAEESSRRASFPKELQKTIVFMLLSGLYLVPFMRVLLLWSNEGTLAAGAVRVLRGEVFARDFFEVMGPGSFYLLAAFFKVLGATFLSMRVYVFLIAWSTGVVLYLLTQRLASRHRVLPVLLVAGTYYGMQWPGVSHHVDGNCFALLSVLFVTIWHEKRWDGLLVAAGALAGVTACIHQPKGVLLLLASLAWLAWESRSDRRRVLILVSPTAGFAVVLGLVCCYFLSRHALGSLYYTNVIWPAHNYGDVNHVRYGLGIFSEYWRGWAFQGGGFHWSTALASFLVIPFMYVAVLPIILLLLLATRSRRAVGSLGLLYLVCGAAIWISEWHRHDIYHLAFASPLLIIVSLHLFGTLEGRAVRIGVQVLATASACLAGVNLLSTTTARTVTTRVGTPGIYKESGLLGYLQAEVHPGEKMFVYPYRPIYYFLTDTLNPTRYLTLTYNYNTTAEFQDAINALERDKVRVVVWDRKFQLKEAPLVFSPAAMHPPDGFLMEDYLSAHYTTVKDIDGVLVLERNADCDIR